jgi:hypothetical protein
VTRLLNLIDSTNIPRVRRQTVDAPPVQPLQGCDVARSSHVNAKPLAQGPSVLDYLNASCPRPSFFLSLILLHTYLVGIAGLMNPVDRLGPPALHSAEWAGSECGECCPHWRNFCWFPFSMKKFFIDGSPLGRALRKNFVVGEREVLRLSRSEWSLSSLEVSAKTGGDGLVVLLS